MTTIQKLYQILQNDNKSSTIETSYTFKPTRPNKPVSFNNYNIPQTRKNKSLKEQLAKVLAFIDLNKQRRFSDGITVMPIATTNKRLISIWGSSMNVSNAIKFMINAGLLAEYDESYQFNAYYNKDNRSKQYAYKYETEQQIKEYCKINNINKYQIINTTIVKTFAVKDIPFEQDEVRFSSKLHLLKPDNWSCAEFENYLTGILYVNYPQLKHYQELADKINETYYADDYDRQVRFKPNFTWNKGNKAVTKIGIRATNALVSAKKEHNNDLNNNILYKDEVLSRYGLKYEFDVKSSVPRLTYALNKGVWLDNDIDLYEIMYNKFIKLCPSEQLQWNDETRKIFKSFHMNGYFDTEAKLSAHLKRQVSMKVKYNKEEWSDLDYVMKSYRESIVQTVGELKYDSEVFFHESCIYLDVTNELLSRGYNVWQQYDCWYTDKEVDVKQIVEQYVSRYINKSSSSSSSNNNNNNNKHSNINKINTTIVKTFAKDNVNLLVDEALSYYIQE